YGDGSVVCVPAPGHTPGSIIIFVTLPRNVRYAFVGDLVWQREGLTKRVERPRLIQRQADTDPGGNRQNLLHMVSLMERIPHMLRVRERTPESITVPAHDQRPHADMARLPNVTTRSVLL